MSTPDVSSDGTNQRSVGRKLGRQDNFKHAEDSSTLQKIRKKLGLDIPTLKKMLRISIAPTIAIAIFQSDRLANHFTLDGYFIAMLALASAPTLPRARYVRTAIGCAFAIALSAAIALLATWSALQARKHTTNDDSDKSTYNSSQAAVLAVWLVFTTYAQSFYKAANPQQQLTAINFGLVQVAGLTGAVKFTSMEQAMNSMAILLEAFLLGLGLAFAVGLLIFPETSRGIFFKQVSAYFEALKTSLASQVNYVQSIESVDPWYQYDDLNNMDFFVAQKKALDTVYGLAAKLRMEEPYAERELAYGKLSTHDISTLTTCILRIMPALSGIGAALNVIANRRVDSLLDGSALEKQTAITEWQTVMEAIHEPCEKLLYAMHQAIDHTMVVLELKKHQSGSGNAGRPALGSAEFVQWYDKQTEDFAKFREIMVKLWSEMGHNTVPAVYEKLCELKDGTNSDDSCFETKHRRPFTIIYIQYLLFAASREISEVVTFVDEKVGSKTLTKRHWISPTFKRPSKWLGWASMSYHTGQFARPMATPNERVVHRDPEHLPPTNWYERLGNQCRRLPKLLRSRQSVHGLRVTCAVMTFAVGFFIRTSSNWFSRYRFIWALFTVLLTMNDSAGMSTFMFLCRTAGTFLAMVAAFIVYYIVDGRPAGVITFLWVYFLLAGYLVTKFPFYTPFFMVSGLAMIAMVAGELQDKKLGFERVNNMGQAAYEEYVMAPLRLAIVTAGNIVGFFWTVVPYPMSEHSGLREDLGRTFFYLASHHAMISQTVTSRAQGHETMATRHFTRLAQARVKCFTKLQFLFVRLRNHLTFTKWQIVLGGKFPRDKYAEMIELCEEILTVGSVIGYASASFVRVIEQSKKQATGVDKWMHDFQQLLSTVEMLSEEITSALVMLSNHITNGSPFPPYTRSPEAFKLAKKLEELNHGMLNVEHAVEPAYAAFVTMTMAGRTITRALDRQIEIAKELVGVLDFSSFINVEEQALIMPDENTGMA